MTTRAAPNSIIPGGARNTTTPSVPVDREIGRWICPETPVDHTLKEET